MSATDTAPTSSLAALYAALAAAQGEFPAIPKTKTVNVRTDKGAYSFDYAPLDAILAAVRPVLAAHGLAVSQAVDAGEGGKIALHTHILHSGGGALSSTFPLPALPQRAQDVGGLLTYYRRYALCAVLSIAADDDTDGDAPGTQAVADRKPKAAPAPKPAPSVGANAVQPADLKALMAQMNEAGLSYGIDAKGKQREEIERQRRLTFLGRICGRPIQSSKELTPAELGRAKAELASWIRFVALGTNAGLTSMEALMEVVRDRAGHHVDTVMDQTDDEANACALFLKSSAKGAA